MNETDLYRLLPVQMATQAKAVSPVIKITSSQPTKKFLSVFVPKPGYSTLGSVKLGLRTRIQGESSMVRSLELINVGCPAHGKGVESLHESYVGETLPRLIEEDFTVTVTAESTFTGK